METTRVESRSSGADTMPFIISSNIDKADATTRKLIRSHVMRGRKKKNSKANDDKSRPVVFSPLVGCAKPKVIRLEELLDRHASLIWSSVSPAFYCSNGPHGIEASMLANMVQVSSMAMRVMCPLLMAVGSRGNETDWADMVRSDAAALHVTAFAMQTFADRVLRGRDVCASPAVMRALQTGLTLLRQRLLGDDEALKTANSTIGVVVKLANAALFAGDLQSARRHRQGLGRMVELRGGTSVFAGRHLRVEMLRCDLAVALLDCASTVFFASKSEPIIQYPERLTACASRKTWFRTDDDPEILSILNPRLADAWRVMRRFCLLVNLGSQTGRPLHAEIINETMEAVMYRLLRTSFPSGSLDEMARYGLLSFTYHVFLQWQDIRFACPRFQDAYRASIVNFETVGQDYAELLFWVLMAGAISVFDVSAEGWLQKLLHGTLQSCQVDSWTSAQRVLKNFMWIELLDDQTGKLIVESLPKEII